MQQSTPLDKPLAHGSSGLRPNYGVERGYVPGIHDETNSGLAEAYGMTTALRFLNQYICLYPIALSERRKVHVYCDNQGVIERINNHSTNIYPRDTIRDDYSIYADIQQQILQLQPIVLVFQHVKGHQDKQKDHVMMTPEKLNIDCDRRAAQVPLPCPDPDIQNTPLIDTAYPHVMIAGKVIQRQLQHKLRDAATFPMYREYLQTKFQWPSDATDRIQWKVHQLANQHLMHSEQRVVTKFIHEWLPLLDRYHVLSSSLNKQCPSCRQELEMTEHFLNCSHPE